MGTGWARREGSLSLINTDPEPQPLFNSFYIFLFIQKQLTFTETFLSSTFFFFFLNPSNRKLYSVEDKITLEA